MKSLTTLTTDLRRTETAACEGRWHRLKQSSAYLRSRFYSVSVIEFPRSRTNALSLANQRKERRGDGKTD